MKLSQANTLRITRRLFFAHSFQKYKTLKLNFNPGKPFQHELAVIHIYAHNINPNSYLPKKAKRQNKTLYITNSHSPSLSKRRRLPILGLPLLPRLNIPHTRLMLPRPIHHGIPIPALPFNHEIRIRAWILIPLFRHILERHELRVCAAHDDFA